MDDTTIPDASTLYRRVPPYHQWKDPELGCNRCSSGLLRSYDTSIGLSIELDEREPPRAVEQMMVGYEDNWLISLPVVVARSDEAGKQCINRDPTPEEPWHGLMLGKKRDRNLRVLQPACEWVVPPPDNPCARPYPT